MIRSLAYDIEVLPNFFSIAIVDINSYLAEFKDACVINKKGKASPIPLCQKYKVKEIKEKLTKVKKKGFYITDDDGSQLLPMIGFINNMMPQMYGNIPVTTHMFGYNSNSYDKLMVAGLLSYFNIYKTTKELIYHLYELSQKIISSQGNDASRNDYLLKNMRTFKLPYMDIDVMKIFALNKVGKGVDANGKTIYFGKGLKQTSINLQWYELLEYELPPISDIDRFFYDKEAKYKNRTNEELNKLIPKWNRYIISDWIIPTMHYNFNDVYIVCEMIRLNMDEINLRYKLSSTYEINAYSSSRSNIANILFEKFYTEFSGIEPSQWKGKKTERRRLDFNKVILPTIHFKTPDLQELLNEMKQVTLYSIGKKGLKEVADSYTNLKHLKTNNESGWFEVTINNLTYTIATGGLHSKDIPRVLKSKLNYIDNPSTGEDIWDNLTDDSYIYVHWDIASFYPSLMVNFNVAPEHMDSVAFVNLVAWLRDTRVQAKHSEEDIIDGIPKEILAQALKIVINSIYGKLGDENSDICDRLAVLNVTINGQLLIMMLCEELELNGIEVVSANTDGIVIKLYKKDKAKFDEIANNWKEFTGFGADSEEYKYYINRDINNYIIQELNGKVSYKGAMNPLMYLVDLQKGYDEPIVAQAVSNYFLENKPVLETLYEANNILDFCKTQNVGRQFHVEFVDNNGKQEMQRYVRFYASNSGGSVFKIDDITKTSNNMCAGQKVTILNTLDDMDIRFRDINYQYYLEEANKIIDPIRLNISPNQKGDKTKGTKSGKALIKKYSGAYNTLFDDNEE